MCSIDIRALSRAAIANLKFDEPLDPDDVRLVQLDEVRGDFQIDRLLWQLAILEPDGPAETDRESQHLLFGGHRGCGKSTELRRLARDLNRPDRYFVVFVDALTALDINNLRYSDISLAQAKALFTHLEDKQITLEQVFLAKLESWFNEHVRRHEKTREFAAQIEAGATLKSGIPFWGELFARLQNSLKINATYKDEVRTVVRNTFSEFAEAFNTLVRHAEDKIAEANLGKRVLFIVDGTDRLQGEDAERFFIEDVYQLQLIEANFVYCAPISLLTERSLLHNFEPFRLPMIKIQEKGQAALLPQAQQKLRELITKRVDARLFADDASMDYLIAQSGGHVRDLIRLLLYTLREARGNIMTQEMAERAVRQLATEYRRLIEQDDYPLLVEIDCAPSDYAPVSDKTRHLLYDLILLEYNAYWWQSHPVVRTLPGYQRALADLHQEGSS